MTDTHPDVQKILKSLLGVMDNLERALETRDLERRGDDAMSEGVRSIHRQLTDLLYSYEVRSYTTVGTPFDTERHEAVGQLQSDQVPVSHVAQEFRRGYLIGDRLFRVAQVLVSTGAAESQPVPPPTAAQAEVLKPRSQPLATRSATNRPSWLLNVPQDTAQTVYLMGRSHTAATVDIGKSEAGAALLPELFRKLGGLWSHHPVGPIYTILANPLSKRISASAWSRLTSQIRDLNRWIEDIFWQQLDSDISGKVYDVALLLGIPRNRLDGLLDAHGPEERYARLSFVDLGPFLKAFLDGMGGALVCDVHTGGATTRTGIDPGDIIVKVGNRTMENAALVRQTLTRLGRSRRLFEVEFIRGLEVMGTVRMGSPVTGWGRTI